MVCGLGFLPPQSILTRASSAAATATAQEYIFLSF
jgi:hypothetical protein